MKKYILLLFVVLQSSFLFSQKQKRIDYKLIDQVYSYLLKKKVQHPKIVLHQAILETGWLRGKYLMSRNNLFGFRKKKYMRFKNWQESVDYYKRWQVKHYKNPKENYYNFLVRIKFAGAKQYKSHLLKIKYKPFSKTVRATKH
jgi:hypothetical protein